MEESSQTTIDVITASEPGPNQPSERSTEDPLKCKTQEIEEVFPGDLNGTDSQSDISKINFVISKIRKKILKNVGSHLFWVNVTISEAMESLSRELKELQDFARQTDDEANEGNVNIDECFTYIKSDNFSDIFSDCAITDQIGFIESQKADLDEAESTFNDTIKYCVTDDESTVADQCLKETIMGTKIDVFKIKKSVDVYLSMDKVARFNCIENVFREIDDGLNRASFDFNACVEKVMGVNDP